MAAKKTINCKSCGAEIAKSAKVCPHCGAKNRKNPVLVAVLVILVLVIIAGASGGKEEAKPAVQSGSDTKMNMQAKEKPTEAAKTSFGVGETAELKDVAVTLIGVEESNGSQFNTPTAGNVFVLCEFEIENNSQSEIAISSMMSFNAYCDDYALNYSLSAGLEKGNKNQLDGQVAAGKKMNGVIGYEVPKDWKEIEIRFTPNFWSGKEIVFVANH